MSTIPDQANLGIVLPGGIAGHIHIDLEHANETSICLAVLACIRPSPIGLPSVGSCPHGKPESVTITTMMMSLTE
jgi:hypothetical protein